MPDNNRLYTLDGLLRNGIFDNQKQDFMPVEKVLIPKIQRPYAQGRLSQTEIRDNFLDDLYLLLTTPGQTIELNFVYGTVTDGTFELLDGQQRLTTLFLLAWYLAVHGNEPQAVMSLLDKFTYETRTTSSGFIRKLVDTDLTVGKLSAGRAPFGNVTPGQFITSLGWYTGAYAKDSTVAGMLVMLDAIHARHTAIAEADRPGYAYLDRIRFYLQNLDNLGLTDELFIKMNARGLQLTPFENFKAELSGWLKSNPFADRRYEKEVHTAAGKLPFWLFFCSSMDGRWNDNFWKKPATDSVDDLGAADADAAFFTFLKRWLANRAITLGQENGNNADNTDWTYFFRYFSEKSKTDRYHSFAGFKEFVVAADKKGFDIIAELTHTLATLSDPAAGSLIKEAFTAPWATTSQKPWERNFEIRPMIIFSAISEFILSQPFDTAKPLEAPHFDSDEFARWMRMVHNVVENRNIDSERVQLATTRQLKDVLQFNSNPVYIRLLDYMKASARDSNREFREEAAKIQRILSDAGWQTASPWEEAFKEAEKNPYMTGSVAFYLDDETDVATYRRRTSHVPVLFNADGVAPRFCTGYPLWRAILTNDTDWSAFKPGAYNIRITNKVSGNRLLKARTVWNEAPQVRRLFRNLLDCDNTDETTDLLYNETRRPAAITFPDDWSEDAKTLASEGLTRLCSGGKDGGALGWLSATGHDPMGILFYKDGVMALYRGYVNCMYLNNHREKFIPELEYALAHNNFTVRYCDSRCKDNLNRFGFYSGEVIELMATHQALGTEIAGNEPSGELPPEEYLLRFTPRFGLQVYTTSESDALLLDSKITELKEVQATLPPESPDIIPGLDSLISGNGVLDANGRLQTHSVEQRLFYLAAYIPDIRLASPAILPLNIR